MCSLWQSMMEAKVSECRFLDGFRGFREQRVRRDRAGAAGEFLLRSTARRGRQGSPQARPDMSGRPTLNEPGAGRWASDD